MNLVPYTVRAVPPRPAGRHVHRGRLERIQQDAHLDFSARSATGRTANGPFDHQPDETLRGLGDHAQRDRGDARRGPAADPAVIAGRMRAEVFTWLVPEGMLAFGEA